MEVLPIRDTLIAWFQSFGFVVAEGSTTSRKELVLVKELIPSSASRQLSALDFNIAYGPGAVRAELIHIVPIQPRFHRLLFPEAEQQHSLFPRLQPCGNAIRKAYLCNASSRLVHVGDTLIFVKSGSNSCASAIGVVESTLVSNSPEEIVAYVGNRTVYSVEEIQKLCERGETLAIRFRMDRVLSPSWPKAELQAAGVLTGTGQSIQRVRKDGIEWIRTRLDG